MKRVKKTVFFLVFLIFFLIPIFVFSQVQNNNQISIRTFHVDWYMYSVEGVKLQYRTFNHMPVVLYLPASFQNKFYRFVEAPKGSGSTQGLPIIIVHLKGKDVTFIDIYTLYQKEDGLIASFTKKDLEKFKEIEKKGKIEFIF